jgi:hypothetical protein
VQQPETRPASGLRSSGRVGGAEQAFSLLREAVDHRLSPTVVYQRLGREADSRQELAAFKKLEESRKRIDQVYVQTRGEFLESDLTGTDAPNNR